jgi:hypothetical protein
VLCTAEWMEKQQFQSALLVDVDLDRNLQARTPVHPRLLLSASFSV